MKCLIYDCIVCISVLISCFYLWKFECIKFTYLDNDKVDIFLEWLNMTFQKVTQVDGNKFLQSTVFILFSRAAHCHQHHQCIYAVQASKDPYLIFSKFYLCLYEPIFVSWNAIFTQIALEII